MYISGNHIELICSFDNNHAKDDWNICALKELMACNDEGYVYLMANLYMPGVYKIGKSINPKRRCRELSSGTGVPGKYLLVASIETPSHSWVESKIHDLLSGKRIKGSEHFKINPYEFLDCFKTAVNSGLSDYNLSIDHPSIAFGTSIFIDVCDADKNIKAFIGSNLNGNS